MVVYLPLTPVGWLLVVTSIPPHIVFLVTAPRPAGRRRAPLPAISCKISYAAVSHIVE